MKVKLLKKLRKRFSITHMPNGYVDYEGEHFNYNLLVLEDNNSNWTEHVQIGNRYIQSLNMISNYVGTDRVFENQRDGINFLKSLIVKRLRSELQSSGYAERINKKHKKVWYCK